MKEIEIFEDIADIEEKLNTDISSGLSRRAAKERNNNEGLTETSFFVRKKRNFISCFLGVVKMLPAVILILVALAAFFMGRIQLSIAVLTTFISGSFISGMLYLSAQRESERMEAYSNPSARVLREGKEYITDCRNLAIGDVIVLHSGDYIPADACVVEAENLVISAICFDSEVKYTEREIADGFDGEGRLLAGSFVKSGFAKAVVTAVGDGVYMSQHIRAGGLAKKNTDPIIIKRAYKNFSSFVSVLSVLALILAIVGIFTAKYIGVLEVFLMYLALILSMTLISSPIAGRILLSAMLKRASKSGRGGDYAIIKNNRAIDVLPSVTDVALFGLSGITDGEKYPSSMLLFGKTLDLYTADSSSFIFECIYSYIKARNADNGAVDGERRVLDGLLLGLERIKFDRDAEDVKIQSLYFGAKINGEDVACVEMVNLSFRVYVGNNLGFANNCEKFRSELGVCNITEEIRAVADEYIGGAAARGETLYAVVSEIDGELIFEGFIGLREGMCDGFSDISDALAKKGIRVDIMLSEDNEYNEFYLRAAGFDSTNILRADNDELIINDGTCAYMGYSPEQYESLILKMKSEGRRVVALGIDTRFAESYGAADIFVCYDNINYGSPKYRDSEIETHIADGYEFSERCSDRQRTQADIIVGRGNSESGGVRGLLEAIKCAESFTYYYLQMLLLFASLGTAVTLITLMSFVSGISLISYPVILLLSISLVFFSAASFSTFKPRWFVTKRILDVNEFVRSAALKLISPILASIVYFVLALYLGASGYIMDVAAIPLATTFGVTLTFAISFFGGMRECLGKRLDISDIKSLAEKDRSKNKILNVAAMTLVLISMARMILTAVIIPAFAEEYGYVGLCLETFSLLGVYVAVFVICELVTDIIRLIIKRKST